MKRETPFSNAADCENNKSLDPVCALYQEWLDIRDHIRIENNDTLSTQLFDRLDLLETRICHTMATSFAGIQCQICWLKKVIPHGTANDLREIQLLTQIHTALQLLQCETKV